MKEELRKDSERIEKEMKDFESGADWESVTIRKFHHTTSIKLSKDGAEEVPDDSCHPPPNPSVGRDSNRDDPQ